MDWLAVAVTLKLAACTTLLLLIVGLPLAYWLATSRWHGRMYVEAIVTLPIVLPPTVLGFFLMYAAGPRSPLGAAYLSIVGEPLVFSFAGILAGSVVFNLPFAVRPFMVGFRSVDRTLVEAAWCLGASKSRTFAKIVLPLAAPGILAGMALTFAHTMGEFGVALMIGGNVPGITRTLSIAIYDDVQSLKYASAAQSSALIIAISFTAMILVHRLQSRRGET